MKTSAAFVIMLVLGAVGAVAVLRVPRSDFDEPQQEISAASPLVLAGHPATFALSHALAARTSLQVMSAWPAGTAWAEQAEVARQSSTEWQARARRSSAVVTLRHAAPGDALFATVRAHNPRVVEIDASVTADQQTLGVRLRAGGAAGTGFTMSPTNVIRLAERIAADFTALYPGSAAVFAENLRALKERLLRLKAKFEKEFALVAAPEVAAFSGEFDYLCEDFGLQIVERIEKDFASWSESERAANVERLQRAGARVSLHAFPPSSGLVAVLTGAKVKPIVLDPLSRATTEPEAFFQKLEANLAALKMALGP